jgi:hypothetical protein
MATKDEYYERGRRRYIEEHAPLALPVAVQLVAVQLVPPRFDASPAERRAAVIQETIALLGDMYDAARLGAEESSAPLTIGGARWSATLLVTGYPQLALRYFVLAMLGGALAVYLLRRLGI